MEAHKLEPGLAQVYTLRARAYIAAKRPLEVHKTLDEGAACLQMEIPGTFELRALAAELLETGNAQGENANK